MKHFCHMLMAALLATSAHSQTLTLAGEPEQLYPQRFSLEDVTITGGPFLHAQKLNDSILLAYDEGRLLQPFEKQAGLKESGRAYVNWSGGIGAGLDGHVGGHYVGALASSYASCRDPQMKARLKQRMDHFVSRLKECQDAWDQDADAVMHGYVGGVPESRNVWTTLARGNFDKYWASWVPFYNVHKTFAGLRDAWYYGHNEEARQVFVKLCDWAVNLVANLNDSQMANILGNEHGGMSEELAEAYQMTGDQKYLVAAKKYAHKWLLTGMSTRNKTFLDHNHANTQVPKAIGFERIYQLSRTGSYGLAARFFWEDVAMRRTIAVGGNSVAEWFPAKNEYERFITSIEGVETCNSYNMLKLSLDLFTDSHDSRYTDFIESTMINHILSSQHPVTGGYVYFTSARPQHYRVYSQVNQAMWCCVGSGMENHGKYAEFAYLHNLTNDTLFVNLFMPTELQWKARGIRLLQDTRFPYEPGTRLTVEGSGRFALAVRHPAWCEGFALQVNGTSVQTREVGGYAIIDREWQSGDVVSVSLPMKVGVEPLPNVDDYVAFKYGPVLLGAITGTDQLVGLRANESRMGHVASGQQKDIYSAPLLIGPRAGLAAAVEMTNPDSLHFRINGYYNDERFADLRLQPFHTIHDARYMMYWMNVEGERWEAIRAELQAAEDARLALEARTIDYVVTGTQQSEADHYLQSSGSNSGSYQGEYYRDGQQFGYILSTGGCTEGVTLMARYWGGDSNRTFDIYVANQLIATETLKGGKNEFVNVEYPVPANLLRGKRSVRVRFQAHQGSIAGGLYYLRLCTDKPLSIGEVHASVLTGNNAAHTVYDLQGRRVPEHLANSDQRGMVLVSGGRKFLNK